MWCTICTITSVGYGDYFAKSRFGKIVGMVNAFWGIFIVSFFVVTVSNMLEFDTYQEKTYNLLIRLRYKQDLKKYAVNVLSSAYKYKLTKKEFKNNPKTILESFRDFR